MLDLVSGPLAAFIDSRGFLTQFNPPRFNIIQPEESFQSFDRQMKSTRAYSQLVWPHADDSREEMKKTLSLVDPRSRFIKSYRTCFRFLINRVREVSTSPCTLGWIRCVNWTLPDFINVSLRFQTSKRSGFVRVAALDFWWNSLGSNANLAKSLYSVVLWKEQKNNVPLSNQVHHYGYQQENF